jgi:hypothetical protein
MAEQKINWAEKTWADLELFGTGVPAAYLYKSDGPLDTRAVVEKYEYLEGLVAKNIAYEGMVVYVKEDGYKKHYTYKNSQWVEFGSEDHNNIINNIKDGINTGALQQTQNQESNVTEGYFAFAGKNANAIKLDASLDGEILYGGSGEYSIALGGKAAAIGKRAVAEGTTTIAKGNYSHAEGNSTATLNTNAHAEGAQTTAAGSSSHAEGSKTLAYGQSSHAEGGSTLAFGLNAHAEGCGQIFWDNDGSLRVVFPDETSFESFRGENGQYTESSLGVAYGDHSHVEGYNGLAMGTATHAEGSYGFVDGDCSHVEGYYNVVVGSASHVEGSHNKLSGNYSHAEGQDNVIKSDWSHVTGQGNTLENNANWSVVSGQDNSTSGSHSVVSGKGSSASANNTFVHGVSSNAGHYNAFVTGYKTQSGRMSQLIAGEFNVGKTDTLFEIGNGTETIPRQNAFEVLEDGRAKVYKAPKETEDVARLRELQLSGTVTKTIGGITKDKTYTDATVTDILKDLLFASVAPTFTRIRTSEGASTYEYGDAVTVSTVTPEFTLGSKPITSIKIGTTSGGNDLYEGSTATSGVAITLAEPKVYDGTTGGDIYCTISDGEFSVDTSAHIGYTYYTYYTVTDTSSLPGTNNKDAAFQTNGWICVGSATISDIEITAEAGQYIWIAHTRPYTSICEYNELGKAYNDPAPTARTSANTLKNRYGYEGDYYFYQLTTARKKSGTAKFKLV